MKRKPQWGSIYKRKKRLRDGTIVDLGPWWIKYSAGSQIFRESSKSERYGDADQLLKHRIGEIGTGVFQGLRIEKVTVEGLLDEVLLDYKINAKAVRFAKSAIENYLRPYFLSWRARAVTTEAVKKYVDFRKGTSQGTRSYRGRLASSKQVPIRSASNATINRELALLKHAFNMGWKSTRAKYGAYPTSPCWKKIMCATASSSMTNL
jgi:hypothetical protein